VENPAYGFQLGRSERCSGSGGAFVVSFAVFSRVHEFEIGPEELCIPLGAA
jgi:hypothetical protein